MNTWAALTVAEQDAIELLVCDALGIAAAGPSAPGIADMLAALAETGGGDVTPLWTDIHVNGPVAGLTASLLIHAWDFDDTHDDAVVHTASVAIAAVLAVAQLGEGVPGERMLDGIVAGIQSLSRLSRLTGPSHGVIRTAGLGAVAAAIASATAMGLPAEQVNSAAGLALTSTLSPTTRQAVVDGSLAKRLQPGLGVQTGIVAALLARNGVTGPTHWLSGDYGLVPGVDSTLADLFAEPFELSGLALKPYPACRYTHAALAAAHELIPRVQQDGTIERIVVHVSDGEAYRLVSRPYEHRGSPVIDAQFSIPWQVAAVAVTGRYDLGTLVRDLGSAEITDFAARVEVVQDLPASAVMAEATVDVILTDGTVHSQTSPMPGSAEHPLTWDQLAEKLASCLAISAYDVDPPRIRYAVRALAGADAAQARSLIRALHSPTDH